MASAGVPRGAALVLPEVSFDARLLSTLHRILASVAVVVLISRDGEGDRYARELCRAWRRS